MAIAIGDIHGDLDVIYNFINKLQLMNQNFIQVGDFGMGVKDRHNPTPALSKKFQKKLLFDLNSHLADNNNILHIIRGNHDNPEFWSKQLFNFSNIKFVEDYSVHIIEGRKFLFVGGAISIDRKELRKKERKVINWWKGEKFVFDLKKLKKLDLSGLDTVITHSAPRFAHPRIFGPLVEKYAKNDKTLKEELIKERDDISRLFDYLKENDFIPKRYVYGHFHHSYVETIEDTEFVLLAVKEFKEI